MGRLFGRDRGPAQPRTVTIAETGRAFTVKGKDSILNEALEAGVPFPHNCTVGTCGTCKARLLDGKVRELSDSAIALSAEELQTGFILPCQSVAKGSIELGVEGLADVPDHLLVHAQGTIGAQRQLTHDIVEITVNLDRPLDYSAGQYAELRFDGITGPRSYSFAAAPSQRKSPTATFYVRLVAGGEFTGWLFGADRSGCSVQVTGPFGNLWLRPTEAPILCVAGGSGLAPIKALVEEAISDGCQRDLILVFGAREQRDLYAADELRAIEESWTGTMSYLPVLSEESPGSDWTGNRGFVTDVVADLPQELLAKCDVYTCGPPVMIDALEALLTSTRDDLQHAFHADRFVTRAPMP